MDSKTGSPSTDRTTFYLAGESPSMVRAVLRGATGEAHARRSPCSLLPRSESAVEAFMEPETGGALSISGEARKSAAFCAPGPTR